MMIVPNYWAEEIVKHKHNGRTITIRRFGWSDESEEQALTHAQQRAGDALKQVLAGEPVTRLEANRSYNGADGVPIREEVVSRHGDNVVTRNGYGALCLNTPNVLFADVDFEYGASVYWYGFVFAILMLAGAGYSLFVEQWRPLLYSALASVIVVPIVTAIAYRIYLMCSGGIEGPAYRRIRSFSNNNPDWNFALYRTPAGFRVLVLHRTFEPNDPVVDDFFSHIKADPIYQLMCQKQHCFRARLSPKPWRIGITEHIEPRTAVLPIPLIVRAKRLNWIRGYEQKAKDFAACKFVENLGSAHVDSRVKIVRALHDEKCRVKLELPLA